MPTCLQCLQFPSRQRDPDQVMKIENADIKWLDSGLPYSSVYDDIYHSSDDAAAESRHVFIEGNKLSERWADSDENALFTIAELGFGSGLNFLETVRLWRNSGSKPARLNYLGFEKHPFTRSQLQQIFKAHPDLQPLFAELLPYYPQNSSGCHRIQFGADIVLDLYYGDALQQINTRYRERSPAVDCWFLDGFSPTLNPDLWSEDLFLALAKSSRPGTTLSSYSVAGQVRKALQATGFDTSKSEGFGRKRHMLQASLNSPAAARAGSHSKPWLQLPDTKVRNRKAIVIGAGIAGCSTAYSLATRGWQVELVEKAGEICAGASGIPQMALRNRFFRKPGPMAEFFLHSFLFASRQYHRLATEHPAFCWHPTGVLQLDAAVNSGKSFDSATLQAIYPEEVLTRISCEQASQMAEAQLTADAWLHGEGGWLSPRNLCETYLDHPNITLHLKHQVLKLEHSNNEWLVDSADGPQLNAEVVILASSHDSGDFTQSSQLPLQKVRGQVSRISPSPESARLNTVINGERSVFPVFEGLHTVSASYSDDEDLQARDTDNQENLELASRNFQDQDFLGNEVNSDSVAIRCNSEDHLPIIGAVPDHQAMTEIYSPLSLNAKASLKIPGNYLPGLFINIAHGSNGVATTCLAAEFLASLINKENLPISRDMINELNPVRFLIRELKKQKGK